MVIFLIEQVFPRSSCGFYRVIRLQDRSKFRQEAAYICEQAKFCGDRPRDRMVPAMMLQKAT